MTDLSRCHVLGLLGAISALGFAPMRAEVAAGATLGPATPFDPEMIIARTLAAAPYSPPPAVSQDWLDLSYDGFRGIWFDTRHTLYRGMPGAVQAEVFVAGLYFPHKIGIHAVEKVQSREVQFGLRLFDTTDQFAALPEDGTGFAGFRLLGELEAANRFQEYAVFQGASYFRAIGRRQAYGLSARSLALNTAADGPEEFPVFRDFWIEAAEPGAAEVTVHALMATASRPLRGSRPPVPPHGKANRTVPLEGREITPGFVQGNLFEAMEIWRDANGCPGAAPDGARSLGIYTIEDWTSCAPGASLSFALHDGGHSIPKDWAQMAVDWFEVLP